MPRSASSRLIAHLSSPSATVAYLQKTGPLPDDSYICINSTAKDIDYDDGSGLRRYYARTGLQLANIAGANDLSAENTEASTLAELPTYPGQGVTRAMVDNGDLDNVEFVIYAINYMDHSMGHCICAGGPIGKVSSTPDGNLIIMELRGWCDLLRQNSVVENWSLTCRVKQFGSQPGDEPFPCKYDISGEWITGVAVTSVGAETVRDFAASSLAQPDGYFQYGKVLWRSGNNEGRTNDRIEAFAAGGSITLLFVTRHPIQVGDTFDIMRGCSRKWAGVNSCETYGNRLNFRGEPWMPVADTIGLSVPGAADGGY